MKEKKTYRIKDEKRTIASEPTSEYGNLSKYVSMPGCCSLNELNVILDRAEKNFSAGKGVSHKDALDRILSW